jgi:hypothetical protein
LGRNGEEIELTRFSVERFTIFWCLLFVLVCRLHIIDLLFQELQ